MFSRDRLFRLLKIEFGGYEEIALKFLALFLMAILYNIIEGI